MSYLPSFRLDGRVALITGAGKGLGEHIAGAFAEAGAHVVAVGREGAALERVASEIRRSGMLITPMVSDVLHTEGLSRFVLEVEEKVGPVDILVNNAGTNIQQDAVDVDEASWDQVLDLNLKATFFLSQAVGKRMLDSGRPGRIINIASQIGAVGFYKRSAYAASKGGLVQMSKVMALEWAPHGIRVNCVGPTFIDSPLAREMMSDPVIADEVMRRLPIGRLGQASEVAAATVFLATDGADLITGHHLLVDGGWTAQ